MMKEEALSIKVPLIYSSVFKNYLVNLLSINSINRDTDDYLIRRILDKVNSGSDMSFIDATDKEDTVTFLPIGRLYKQYKNVYPEYNQKTFTSFIKSEENLYNVKKYINNYAGVWSAGRFEMKIGKFLKRIDEKLSDKEIELFVNKYKALYRERTSCTLTLVTGPEIKHWYDQANYAHSNSNPRNNGLGQLGASCMRYSMNVFDLYVENPEVCQLLILQGKDETKILGRALIWKLKNGSYYMDRVYAHYDSDVHIFRKYADERGWAKHSFNTMPNMSVALTKSKFKNYPYMDSFQYINLDSLTASTFRIKRKDGESVICCRSTTGTFDTI